MAYTVKAVADLSGLTVRALHHYDHIGLVRPSATSAAGYRLYVDADLERLQQVLFFRELGFALGDVRAILDNPGFDRREALAMHRKLLVEKRKRLQALIASMDRTIEAMEKGTTVKKDELFEGFDESKMEEYREEANAKYGKEVVDASYRRLGKYSTAEQARMWAESGEINRAIAARMEHGPADPEVQRRVAQWHKLINDYFYDCSPQMFRVLGNLYVDDSRFTAFYDKVRPGMAPFMRDAMHHYADRLEAGSQG